jgi:hypothetical protein
MQPSILVDAERHWHRECLSKLELELVDRVALMTVKLNELQKLRRVPLMTLPFTRWGFR